MSFVFVNGFVVFVAILLQQIVLLLQMMMMTNNSDCTESVGNGGDSYLIKKQQQWVKISLCCSIFFEIIRQLSLTKRNKSNKAFWKVSASVQLICKLRQRVNVSVEQTAVIFILLMVAISALLIMHGFWFWSLLVGKTDVDDIDCFEGSK